MTLNEKEFNLVELLEEKQKLLTIQSDNKNLELNLIIDDGINTFLGDE
jgi:hypothetical protein